MMRRKHGVDVRASFHARTSNPRTVGGTSNQVRFLSRSTHCHTLVEIIPGRIPGRKQGLGFMILNASGLLQSTPTPPRDKVEQQLPCSRAITVEHVPFQLKSTLQNQRFHFSFSLDASRSSSPEFLRYCTALYSTCILKK